MSKISNDIGIPDAMPSRIDTRSNVFGCTAGKTAFRSGLGSQDFNELNMQIGSSKNAENMLDRRLRAQGLGGTLSAQYQLNQDLRSTNHVNISASSRTFGLQSRNSSSVSSSNREEGLRLTPPLIGSYHPNNASIASRTFGLISEDRNGVTMQNNGRFNNHELKIGGSSNSFSSIIPRPFGTSKGTLSSHSEIFTQNKSRVNQDADVMNYVRNDLSTVSRTCLGPDNLGSLISHDSEQFNQDLQRNNCVNSTVNLRSFGLQSRTQSRSLNPEMSLRINQDSILQNNNITGCSKAFVPTFRSTTLATRLNMEENLKCNDNVIENGGFKRPTLSRMIRGRSSTLTSRLFHNQNNKRDCRELSNINGFSVSHISQRVNDTESESRLALNTRCNWMSNQSVSGSVLSTTSLKSEFINLLENLHHSILNICPQVAPEAVSLEFDKAKQRLEGISEISFVPSVKENCGASVISQSSKSMCPTTTEPTTSAYIDGGFLNLKSSKDLLKTLISGKDNYRDKFNLSTHVEEEEEEQQREELSAIRSFENKKSHSPEVSDLVFKKPKPYVKKKKNLQVLKSSEVVKSPTSGKNQKSKVINLKHWYPVAVGSDLLFCGIDEKGATVKTGAVKKRLNNRKVELINGFCCNLIGSPSASGFSKEIMKFLKNGLTDRWRILQKELLNYSVLAEQAKKGVLMSPRLRSVKKKEEKTPEGKNIKNYLKTPEEKTMKNQLKSSERIATKKKLNSREGKTIQNKLKTPKVISTPKKKKEYHTRSGRIIKPPSNFWIVKGVTEVSSTLEHSIPEVISKENLSKKNSKNTTQRPSLKKNSEDSKREPFGSEYMKEKIEETSKSPRELKKGKSPGLKGKSPCNNSPNKSIKTAETIKNSKKKQSKFQAKSPQKNKKKENREDSKMHSFIEDVHRETKTFELRGTRKRCVNGDVDSVLAKKSKLEKKNSIDVKHTIETPGTVSNKKKKSRLKLSLPKRKKKKSSPVKKAKTAVKRKIVKILSESRTDANEINEFEDDFELKLNDIEIPEIANITGNLQPGSSRLKLISVETPPLKYFNTHLNLLTSATPVRSPGWCVSQRTESEVKQFQKRREEAFKKKIDVEFKKTVIKDKSKNLQNRDVKRVMEWVAEKTVKSPHWSSSILQYVIPSRKQLEERMNDEEDEDMEAEFL